VEVDAASVTAMELSGSRALVVGATGVLGGLTARALLEAGATVVGTGRDRAALDADLQPLALDLLDVDGAAEAVRAAAERLGGLDLVVVATGVPAFGPAVDTDAAVAEELFAVNTLGPMAVVRAAAPLLTDSETGVVVVLSAILAELPTNQMADYSASKAALSAWLGVLRRENRRRFRVVDVRPPHLDTGLSDRALAGTPPTLPTPLPGSVVVDAVIRALQDDKASEVAWDASAKELVVR